MKDITVKLSKGEPSDAIKFDLSCRCYFRLGYVGMIDTYSLCDNHYEYAEGMEEK